jgi:DTW domain-containing protein YfiP
VLILQHPQEPDKQLGTAPILERALPNATLKVGLSWRNLAQVVGREVDPKEWLVLYLGSSKAALSGGAPIVLVDKEGNAAEDQSPLHRKIKGLVVLDGTWSQAKTLWWRNAWLLKLHRGVISPERPSLYGNLRREPRRESISTLESAAIALAQLEKNADLFPKLIAPFRTMLERAKESGIRPPKKPDYRRGFGSRRRRARP